VRFVTGRKALAAVLRTSGADIEALTGASAVEEEEEEVVVVSGADEDPAAAAQQAPARCLAGVSGELQVLLPIEGLVDLEALRGRLQKDLARAEKEIRGLSGRLANPSFAGKAPADVVAECRVNLAEAEAQAELALGRLADLG
jgi:valyl-tRNA synthetase